MRRWSFLKSFLGTKRLLGCSRTLRNKTVRDLQRLLNSEEGADEKSGHTSRTYDPRTHYCRRNTRWYSHCCRASPGKRVLHSQKKGNQPQVSDVSSWAASAYFTDVEAELAGDAVSPRGVRRTSLDVFHIITGPTDRHHKYFVIERRRVANCGSSGNSSPCVERQF